MHEVIAKKRPKIFENRDFSGKIGETSNYNMGLLANINLNF